MTVITCFIRNKIGLLPLRVIKAIKITKADFYRSSRLAQRELPFKPIWDVPFLRVSFFSINSLRAYENRSEIPKRVMTICSRAKGYCFQEQ